MKRWQPVLRLAAAAVLLLAPAAGAFGVRRTEDPLALVPADAATVGVMHWSELRQTPLGAKVFSDIDHMSGDDDAARFLQETGLTPREDIDTVIVAMTPRSAGGPESALVLFEGRFDLARIASALAARGAKLQSSPAGEFYLLPDRSGESGAVALVNRTLIVCGHEASVAAALARRESGGEGGLGSGQGLGRHLGRVDQSASAWALVDLARMPSARAGSAEGKTGEPSHALMGAMKSVSLIAVQATVRGGNVDFAATGLSPDAENRGLLEDALKGMLAMWRLAISDKAPELVSVIRRFQIESDGEGVSIRGTLPAGFLKALADKHQASR